jgi:hypothetical protein
MVTSSLSLRFHCCSRVQGTGQVMLFHLCCCCCNYNVMQCNENNCNHNALLSTMHPHNTRKEQMPESYSDFSRINLVIQRLFKHLSSTIVRDHLDAKQYKTYSTSDTNSVDDSCRTYFNAGWLVETLPGCANTSSNSILRISSRPISLSTRGGHTNLLVHRIEFWP